jgi:threonyl-tRNA synthetase
LTYFLLQLKQVDFNLPQRFDITYVDANSEKKRPIMIHRAVLGSLERFFGVLIEHYAGDFPLWLSPVQARILPVTDAQVTFDYLELFADLFCKTGSELIGNICTFANSLNTARM